MLYANGTANITLTDLDFALSHSAAYAVNLPAIVGADTAYVGFGGGTGGYASTQTVSSFQFVSYPTLTATAGSAGTVVLSWPASIGGYALLQKGSLTTGTWGPSPAVVNLVGGQYQAVVPASGGTEFYRLLLQ